MRVFTVILFVLITACKEAPTAPVAWTHDRTIDLKEVNPIGIVADGNDIFLSDGDHNRVVKIDQKGHVIFEINDFERPMHIDFGEAAMKITDNISTTILKERALFVPEYGTDSIVVMRDNNKSYLVINDSLDAPAAISVYDNEIAIADFYNNRILYYNGDHWQSIGQEGKELGDFYYPTDVQITQDAIYVADAYNHRGQLFDKTGKALKTFGEDLEMNAATGIFVTDKEVYLTDFENNRIIVFDKNLKSKQILETDIDKPTDVYVIDDVLYITNYRKGQLVVYKETTVKG